MKISMAEEEAAAVHGNGDSDEKVLEFLDSLEGYLTLMESLASTLRQGWFELASARHSMGVSRVSSASLDLKDHLASTYLEMTQHEFDESIMRQPQFSLRKWASFENGICSSGEEKPDSPQLRQRCPSQISENQEDLSKSDGSHTTVDDLVKKERSKSLSVFGTLVSPKLRAAQASFETALDILVEVANLRSSMLSARNQVQRGIEETRK
ncbi:coiled-coil domain-containing protein 115 isoform X2 [Punica granatum]|uniref:Vacuolar ATPase assembly protein VMA22 n=1 Tax=Punica granatum TaxID=22663 RepID=A0A218X8Y6_PUNGR|nr:coiled-coil domain-containing protein 115 isoform X2 [Punica granatum]OWM81170.1 hypothetical protein CDL15_Pgr007201 [Punica granatum]